MEEGAVNAEYLCVSVKEAFLPVLLHAEGTSASVTWLTEVQHLPGHFDVPPGTCLP